MIPNAQAKPQSKTLPFSIGEKIHYNVRWEKIKAGNASIEVKPFTKVRKQKAYHFKLTAKTTRYVDLFYKVRDTLQGYADETLSKSLLYKKNCRGTEPKEVIVKFNHKKQRAVYSNFGNKNVPIDIPPHTFDPVSSFYKMRTLDLKSNKVLKFFVTDGKKCFLQKAKIVAKEKITTPAGTFDTYLLVPEVQHFSGVFKKSKNPKIKVWISADKKQLPVRIKVKVLIGSVIFDLVSAS
ncbi:MAG: DUF3108 domain-containing protein [Desulfobacteraceae bacterium]|nr:DUF3108 domain-containing protein [Desulfobacteraceae bacterium]